MAANRGRPNSQGGLQVPNEETALQLLQEDFSLRRQELNQRAVETLQNVELTKQSIAANERDREKNRNFILKLTGRVALLFMALFLVCIGTFLWLVFGGYEVIAVQIGKGAFLLLTHGLAAYVAYITGRNKQKAAGNEKTGQA